LGQLSRLSRTRRLSWSFYPFSVSQAGEPAYPGFTSPGTFRSQGFTPSQRFASPLPSWVCFTPVPLLGFHFRAFPSERAGTPLGALSPLAVIALRPPRWAPPLLCPGNEATGGSASGVCSLSESVLIDLVISQIERRCPPGFFLSRDFPLTAVHSPFGSVPLLRLLVPSPQVQFR
jgi:hypothetical protein